MNTVLALCVALVLVMAVLVSVIRSPSVARLGVGTASGPTESLDRVDSDPMSEDVTAREPLPTAGAQADAALLSGRVITQDNVGVEGASVSLVSTAGADLEEGSVFLTRTTSDADGRFVFEAPVNMPNLLVVAEAPGQRGPTGEKLGDAVVHTQIGREIVIVLEPLNVAVTVVGRVVDGNTDQLLPRFELRDDERFATPTSQGSKVRWVPVRQSDEGFRVPLRSLHTDESGRVLVLAIEARGFLGQVLSLPMKGDGTVNVGVIRMERSNECWGIVVDANERPIGGATVEAIVRGDDGWLEHAPATTRTREDDGSFVLSIASRVELSSLYVAAPGFAPRFVRLEDLGGAWDGAVIRMGAGGRIDGQVVWADGRPAADMSVMVSTEGIVKNELAGGAIDSAVWSQQAKSNTDGIYHMDFVPCGRVAVAVVASVDDGRPVVRRIQLVTIGEGSGATCDFRLGDGCEVSGSIEFPSTLFGPMNDTLYLEIRAAEGDASRAIAALPAQSDTPFAFEDVPVPPGGADLILRISLEPGFHVDRRIRVSGPRTELEAIRFGSFEALEAFNRGDRKIFNVRAFDSR